MWNAVCIALPAYCEPRLKSNQLLNCTHTHTLSLSLSLSKDALSELPGSLEMAQRINPRAVCAVVATKADLYRLRKVATEDGVVS